MSNVIQDERNSVLKHIRFTVTANSGAWGCATLDITGLEYKGDPKEFQRDVMGRVLAMGYTSILHYNNDLGLLMCCYNTHKELFEEILRHIVKYNKFKVGRKCIDKMKASESEEDKYNAWKEAKDAGVELLFNEYTGKWAMGGCYDEDSIKITCKEEGAWLYQCEEILQLAGFDPKERERTKRIFHNLGGDRV